MATLAPIAPELESIPNRQRLTVEACDRLMNLGMLEGRFEVLDGQVISKMGQNPPHAVAIGLVMEAFGRLFGVGHLRGQSPIAIPDPDAKYNEPEPDVVVTRSPASSYVSTHPGPDDLNVVVEVADTSLRVDLILKARLYARAGIEEYWVLDLTSRRLHVHRAPEKGEYGSVSIFHAEESISPLARLDSAVRVADLLPK